MPSPGSPDHRASAKNLRRAEKFAKPPRMASIHQGFSPTRLFHQYNFASKVAVSMDHIY